MPFQPKFKLLPVELQNEIIAFGEKHGRRAAAAEYEKKSGMTFSSLHQWLQKNQGVAAEAQVGFSNPSYNSGGRGGKVKLKVKMSKEEADFVTRLEKGEASLEEGSKILAAKVFRKIFEHPDDVKFIDLFRTELLKIKKDENKTKEQFNQELLMRLFAGKMPSSVCPNCGHSLFQQTLDGEIEDERTIPAEL